MEQKKMKNTEKSVSNIGNTVKRSNMYLIGFLEERGVKE